MRYAKRTCVECENDHWAQTSRCPSCRDKISRELKAYYKTEEYAKWCKAMDAPERKAALKRASEMYEKLTLQEMVKPGAWMKICEKAGVTKVPDGSATEVVIRSHANS